jgi:hypothetical protein
MWIHSRDSIFSDDSQNYVSGVCVWVIINNTLHVHFFLLSEVVVRNGNRTVEG